MLKNKVIVVAGACGLIGRTVVIELLNQGAIVVATDTNQLMLKSFLEDLNASVSTDYLSEFLLDITSSKSIQDAIQFTKLKYDKIDGFVNTAYPRNENYGKHFFDVEYQDFCENIDVNLGGYFLCSQKFLELFMKQGFGSIVNISSIYGVVAPKFEIYEGTSMTVPVEYGAIKSALIHLTAYMAKLTKGSNIRINCISPGGILDGQPPQFLRNYKNECLSKGMLDSKDVVGSIVFLLSNMSTYINGQNIVIDDGFVL